MSYGVPSRLNFGEFTIMSKQGVQQGDPLGSLLFAIAIHDSIMAVHSLHGVVWSGWFADDGTIQAPLPVFEYALTTLSTSLAAHNITINFAKTKIVTQDPRSVEVWISMIPSEALYESLLRMVFPCWEGTSLVPRYLHFSQPDWKNFDYYVRKLANYLKLTLLSLYYALALMHAESITFCV